MWGGKVFELDKQLQRDAALLGRYPLCLLLMSRDANYPWFILVPQRQDIREIYQLSSKDQQQLLVESTDLSRVLMDVFAGDKLNLAALGNQVPQLHIHHIVRYRKDAAWPMPVWGAVAAAEYSGDEMAIQSRRVTARLDAGFITDTVG